MYHFAAHGGATLSTHYSPSRTTLPRLRSDGCVSDFAVDLAPADLFVSHST